MNLIVSLFIQRGWSLREIQKVGAAFSIIGEDIPVIPDRDSTAGKLLMSESLSVLEQDRMFSEYTRR